MTTQNWINITYLAASVLFIFGLMGLSHPKKARRGNAIGALGMLITIVATLVDKSIIRYELIIVGLIVGGVIGAIMAYKVKMTAMPEMVAALNGFGGGASIAVAGASVLQKIPDGVPPIQFYVATLATGVIGAVTFWGSFAAIGKLQDYIPGKSIRYPGQLPLHAALFLVCIGLTALGAYAPDYIVLIFWLAAILASLLGVLLVLPIGGADMPVVISLLNSYSGLAAAAVGFVLSNKVLIISGSLVGASGIILCEIMCRAMNRSLFNVFIGAIGSSDAMIAKADDVYGGKVKSSGPEEIAMLFDAARRVVIVPGYGLAVSQAQHAVRDLADLLEKRGTRVEYAIHPVAGRMPGHMNVLLAEANIPYDRLREMDDINPTFAQADVALVIGANDVVNPSARNDPKSPIAGMPILDCDKARTVVVIKRSLSPGFAGIPNPLFAADNTLMMFSDAEQGLLQIIGAVEEL